MNNEPKAITAAAIEKAGSGYQLAKILGVTQAAVSGWKNGTKHPSGRHILAMLSIAQDNKPRGLRRQRGSVVTEILLKIVAAVVVLGISVTAIQWLIGKLRVEEFQAWKNIKKGAITTPYSTVKNTTVYYVKLLNGHACECSRVAARKGLICPANSISNPRSSLPRSR